MADNSNDFLLGMLAGDKDKDRGFMDGEALAGTGMGATLAAADDTANLSTNAIVEVPCGASVTLAVLNTSATSITVDDASISITREC